MKVSIITVCKNAKHFLPQTMNSVLSQTYPDIEYIVIDGASTDGTLDLLQEYDRAYAASRERGCTTHKFRWVSEPDSGIYEAMNKGIDMSCGTYLLFLNAGDCLHDESVLADVFSRDHQEDILYGDVVWIDREKGQQKEHSFADCVLNEEFFFHASLAHPSTFIKKDLFVRYGKYDESFSIVSDWEFWIRAILIGRCSVTYLARVVSDFDVHGISSESASHGKHKRERLRVLRTYYAGPVVWSYAVKSWSENSHSRIIACIGRMIAERLLDKCDRSYRLKRRFRT